MYAPSPAARRRKHLMTGFSSRKKLAVIALLAVSVFGLPSAAYGQTQSDVDQAEAELRRAEARESNAFKKWDDAKTALDIAIAEFTDINAQREDLSVRIAKLEEVIRAQETDVANADARAKNLVIDAYTNGGSSGVETAFSLGSIQEILISQALLDEAAVRGLSELDQLTAVNREIDRLRMNLSDQ